MPAETVRGPGGWDDVPAGPGDAVYVSGYGLSCNEREAAVLADADGDAGADETARGLLDRVGVGVMVRVGAAGCFVGLRSAGTVERVPAPAVAAVDSTGAGDAHAGVFLACLADGLNSTPGGSSRIPKFFGIRRKISA